MNLRTSIYKISIILTFTLFITSCSAITLNPKTELLGKWEYISNNQGNSTYFFDLVFLEDGTLNIDGISGTQSKFVIIAPGKLKITSGEDSQVINYDIVEDTLRLIDNNGTNIYKRVSSPTDISQSAAQTSTCTESAATPTQQPPTLTPNTPTMPILTAIPTNQSTATETASVQTREETLAIGSSSTRDVDGMLMMFVPEGSFLMGTDSSEAYAHEKPQHEVFLDAYWMDAYEVSNAMYKSFTEETGYRTLAEIQGYSYMYGSTGSWVTYTGVSWQHPLGAESIFQDELPVTHVNQFDAKAYCEWVGGRLPTEAEWEKAARGEDGRIYPWGNQFNASLLQFDNQDGPISIYSFPEGSSPYGILNMAGNVFEWTSDWYGADYYANSPYDNPKGPSSGDWVTLRGGGWNSSQKHVRTTHRDVSAPGSMNHLLGFRCTMDP